LRLFSLGGLAEDPFKETNQYTWPQITNPRNYMGKLLTNEAKPKQFRAALESSDPEVCALAKKTLELINWTVKNHLKSIHDFADHLSTMKITEAYENIICQAVKDNATALLKAATKASEQKCLSESAHFMANYMLESVNSHRNVACHISDVEFAIKLIEEVSQTAGMRPTYSSPSSRVTSVFVPEGCLEAVNHKLSQSKRITVAANPNPNELKVHISSSVSGFWKMSFDTHKKKIDFERAAQSTKVAALITQMPQNICSWKDTTDTKEKYTAFILPTNEESKKVLFIVPTEDNWNESLFSIDVVSAIFKRVSLETAVEYEVVIPVLKSGISTSIDFGSLLTKFIGQPLIQDVNNSPINEVKGQQETDFFYNKLGFAATSATTATFTSKGLPPQQLLVNRPFVMAVFEDSQVTFLVGIADPANNTTQPLDYKQALTELNKQDAPPHKKVQAIDLLIAEHRVLALNMKELVNDTDKREAAFLSLCKFDIPVRKYVQEALSDATTPVVLRHKMLELVSELLRIDGFAADDALLVDEGLQVQLRRSLVSTDLEESRLAKSALDRITKIITKYLQDPDYYIAKSTVIDGHTMSQANLRQRFKEVNWHNTSVLLQQQQQQAIHPSTQTVTTHSSTQRHNRPSSRTCVVS
jgi:hypothetical protein